MYMYVYIYIYMCIYIHIYISKTTTFMEECGQEYAVLPYCKYLGKHQVI